MITIKAAFEQWEENIKPLVIEQYGEQDAPALSESWNDYTDSVCKDGELTDLQYHYCPAFDDPMPDDDFEFILESIGVSLHCEQTGERPDGLMPESQTHFKCKVSRGNVNKKFYFSCGKNLATGPGLTDLMSCLFLDASFAEYDFDDFCSNLGYDVDSRKAEKIYKWTIKNTKKLRKLFNDSELSDLQEMAQEWW